MSSSKYVLSSKEDLYNIEKVQRLLDEGINIDDFVVDFEQGMTPLMYTACDRECEETKEFINFLLKSGANPNKIERLGGETALFYAAYENNFEHMKLLLDGGADPKITTFHSGDIYSNHVSYEFYDSIKKYEEIAKSRFLKSAKSL